MTIVPNLQILKDGCAGQGTGIKRASDTFRFESAKETFHDGVVVAVPHAAHAKLSLSRDQTLEVGGAGVLAAPIRVVQQPGWRTTIPQCHTQGVQNQQGVHGLAHRPANHFARKQVQHDRQVQPGFAGLNVRKIADPFLVGSGGRKLLVQAVWGRNYARLALGGHRMILRFGFRGDFMQAHQARHPIPPTHHPFPLQARMDPRAAIGLPASLVFRLDQPQQGLVGLFARAGKTQPPGIVPEDCDLSLQEVVSYKRI